MCHTWLHDKFDDVFIDVIALNNENDKCVLVSFASAHSCSVKLSWESTEKILCIVYFLWQKKQQIQVQLKVFL